MKPCRLCIVHTTPATILSIPKRISTMYGESFEITNILDDSMLREIQSSGVLTKDVLERFLQYTLIAQNSNNDAILLACSSIGPAGDIARKVLKIPLFKIDEPMAVSAASGERILVLGTVKSTLLPTSELIRSKLSSKRQTLDVEMIPEIFKYAVSDPDLHDQTIAKKVELNAEKYDTIVLAQASMAGAVRFIDLKQTKTRVLTSLPSGLIQLESLVQGH